MNGFFLQGGLLAASAVAFSSYYTGTGTGTSTYVPGTYFGGDLGLSQYPLIPVWQSTPPPSREK